MINVTKPIKLDFNKKKYQSILAKQYDNNSRSIKIELFADDIPYPIGSGLDVILRCMKPDNTYVLCTIKDGNIKDNVINLDLPESVLSQFGTVTCDIGIYVKPTNINSLGEKIISTQLFYIEVERSSYSEDAIYSSNEYSLLTDIIKRSEIAIENCNQTTQTTRVWLTQSQLSFNSMMRNLELMKGQCEELIEKMKEILGN